MGNSSDVGAGQSPNLQGATIRALENSKTRLMSALSQSRRCLRQASARRLALAGPHGVVLLYHRIADPDVDPWDLSVSPKNFSEQMDVLRSLGDCMTFTDFAQSIVRRKSGHRSISVTFDDGYRDNLAAGLPILEKSGVPATIFITSAPIGTGRDYWWDALARVFLPDHELPSSLTLKIGGTRRQWHNLQRHGVSNPGGWRMNDGHAHNQRHKAFMELWNALRAMPIDDIEQIVKVVVDWAGLERAGHPEDQPLDAAELRRFDASPLIEIGAHTVNHVPLTKISATRCGQEILPSGAALRDMLGHEITSFSYPFGMHNKSTVRSVRDAGFQCSCTVVENIVTPKTDPYRIPRIQVKNWSGEVFEAELRKFIGPN